MSKISHPCRYSSQHENGFGIFALYQSCVCCYDANSWRIYINSLFKLQLSIHLRYPTRKMKALFFDVENLWVEEVSSVTSILKLSQKVVFPHVFRFLWMCYFNRNPKFFEIFRCLWKSTSTKINLRNLYHFDELEEKWVQHVQTIHISWLNNYKVQIPITFFIWKKINILHLKQL